MASQFEDESSPEAKKARRAIRQHDSTGRAYSGRSSDDTFDLTKKRSEVEIFRPGTGGAAAEFLEIDMGMCGGDQGDAIRAGLVEHLRSWAFDEEDVADAEATTTWTLTQIEPGKFVARPMQAPRGAESVSSDDGEGSEERGSGGGSAGERVGDEAKEEK